MHRRTALRRIASLGTALRPLVSLTGLAAAPSLPLFAQGGGRGGRGGGAPATAEASAPLDLTGYWVALVTEDWRFRMVTPAKGDYASVTGMNAAARAVADAWGPDKDTAAGLQCKSYGAAGLMRVPTRLHITWADPNTLKVETDAGTQTRLMHFGEATPPSGDSLQGFSAASWDGVGRGGRGGGGGARGGAGGGTPGGAGAPAIRPGSLKVVTTHLSPGYLRKNGVPYGSKTVLTEYFDRTYEPNGESLLIVTTIVNDPEYLTGEFITSSHFKKIADSGPGWNPTPCAAK